MSGTSIRTRFAPSPTGFIHIGGLYQALFNYACAHGRGGDFVVRIEDTDQTRSVEGAEDVIYDVLDWFGTPEDESPRRANCAYGPYRQAERLELYSAKAEELVKKGHAYYCFCTRERLDKLRKQMQADGKPPMYDRYCCELSEEEVARKVETGESHVIRMKIPRNGEIKIRDEIRGDIVFDSATIDDQVILKSDGFPTYHLAVVVDDHEMKITYVVRGEEWIPSMPKHQLLYEWFGWKMPKHYHTPLLRNPDKSKLSKRHGHTSATWYRDEGFLPEALRNFLALMGWSHPDEKEIFSLEEFMEKFDLADLKAVAPIFDLKKLEWMNGEYIRAMDAGELSERLHDYCGDKYEKGLIKKCVPLVQERIKTLKEFDEYCGFFLEAPSEYEKDLSESTDLLKGAAEVLEKIDDWIADNIGAVLQKHAEDEKMSFGKYFMALRIVLTGKKITPPVNESMEILGKKETLQRIKAILS